MAVHVRRRGVEFHSRMTQILNVNLRNFFKLVKHVFIVGSSGSGKTSTLLLLADLFYENGETILWRDDTSLEFLSLRDVIPWKVFIPEGCKLNYTHANIEYAYYNPWRLNTIFNQIDRDKGNAVVFDLFSYDMRVFIKFWSDFFYGLYRWKRTRIKKRVALFSDEINDLAPSTRRGYIPKQLALSSNLYFAMKKYRKEGVRLVASTHAYGDVHKPVREGFNFYLFRRMDGASVPDRFKRYQKVIERLKVNEMIIVDEAKSFNKMNVDEIVKPKKFPVSWSGEMGRETEVKHKELELWKKRTVLAATLLNKGFGVTYEQLANLLGYKGRTGVHQFMKKKATPKDLGKVEELLKEME